MRQRTRRSQRAIVSAIALCLVTSVVRARAAEPTRVFFAPVHAMDADATSLAPHVADAIMGGLAAYPELSAVDREAINSSAALEALKDTVGCDDASCYTEITGAINAAKIVTGRVAGAGSSAGVPALIAPDVQISRIRRS